MNCPKCGGVKISPHGTNSAGSQRYKCQECKKTFVDNPQKSGRKPIGDRPMSLAERLQKNYKKKKDKFKQ